MSTRILSTKWHSLIDYLLGAFIIASPWLFRFNDQSAQTMVLVGTGTFIIFYSFLTDYELSIAKVIGKRTHLILDMLSGIFLLVSPWLFGFKQNIYLPHLIEGLAVLLISLLTNRIMTGGIPRLPKHPNPYSHHHFTGWLGHKE